MEIYIPSNKKEKKNGPNLISCSKDAFFLLLLVFKKYLRSLGGTYNLLIVSLAKLVRLPPLISFLDRVFLCMTLNWS